jgi:hypothetical protein
MQDISNDSDSLNPNGTATNALKSFQLSGDTKEKIKHEYGKKIILQVEQIINSSYFSDRNIRFKLNRDMFDGRMNMTKFMDFFNMNGKTNYVNISWKAIMIVNTIVNRLVGRWMTKKYKATATAVDVISINKKQSQIDEAEFYMYNKEMLQQVQDGSDVQMIPQDQFIPDDKDQLDLWAKDELRVPEEILMGMGVNQVFEDNGWGNMGVNTRKHKIDAAVVGLIGKETIADKHGKIIDRYCKPENMFYSYSERDDFKDAHIKGEIVSYKISEIRNLYPKLKTEELYEIAKVSKQWNNDNRLNYNTTWNTSMFLPFDDWNVDVVRFTLKSLDVDRNLIKTAKDGSLYVDKPKKNIDELYPGNEYVEKTKWNIYRGVYVRTPEIIIMEWGLEKNMVRPQDYEKLGEAESPYSFFMYQNSSMRNLAVPEKIEEPVEQMILARLKIQQLVANMRPAGYDYDIDGLQEMDLGNGLVKPLELIRVTNQTGNVYHKSRDAEGNRIDTPVKELPNSGSVAQLQQLIETYNYHLQVLRDEIGINEFAEGQTIKPRTGVENVQSSMEVSFNATDYMNDATVSCADESAGKIVCLLHDAVEFGSEEYRKLMSEQDVKDRDFKIQIDILPSTEDITNFENTLNNAMNAQPDLVLYLNPEKIKRIAKKDVQLAEAYFRTGQKRAIEGRMKQAEHQSKMNADAQTQAAVAAEEEKRKSLEMEMTVKTQMETALSAAKQKEIILEGIFGIYAKGVPMPAELQGLTNEIIKNVGLPLFAENIQNQQAIQEGAEEQQEAAEEEQMQQPIIQ